MGAGASYARSAERVLALGEVPVWPRPRGDDTMTTAATSLSGETTHPVQVEVEPALTDRDRLTTLFRLVLAIPHLVLVGAPVAGALSWAWQDDSSRHMSSSGDGGVLGVVVVVSAIIAWFAILFTGKYPDGLWSLAAFYLRWRVRAIAYVSLLRDEYPPFGDGAYPATLVVAQPNAPRDRVSVAFRLLLAIPHLAALWVIGVGWVITTLIAWFSIVLTGRYPASLYGFGIGALRWEMRVEAYLLLLHDQYPPFSLS